MATKQNLTIEELKAQYKAMGEEIAKREKAEAEERNARLKAEKESRYNEVVDAYKKFEELKNKFLEDYGSFTFKTKSSDEKVCDLIFEALGLI